MPRHPLTVDDLWALPRVGTPEPAADGTFAVVPVTTYSMETNEGICRLWKVTADGASPQPLTSAEISSSQPALSPDGTRLAFIRKGGEKPGKDAKNGPKHTDHPQLYILPVGGGEPERVTDLPLGVTDPRWFHDGTKIAFLSEVFGAAPTIEGTAEMAKTRGEDPVKANVTEDRVYRYWDHWLTERKFHHIFVLDLASRVMKDLTPEMQRWFSFEEPKGDFRIAPDGREIAFTAACSDPPYDPLVYGVFTVPVPERIETSVAANAGSGLKSTELGVQPRFLTADHPAHAYRPVYSPDGRLLVYGLQREIDFYADRTRLVSYDRVAGTHTVLTEDWDRSAMEWTFTPDSRALVLLAEVEARIVLHALEIDRPGPATPKEILKRGTLTEPRTGGSRVFFTVQSLNEPPEVYSCNRDGGDSRRLTSFTSPGMSEIELGAVEDVMFEGAGGRPVHMFLVHPPGGVQGSQGAGTASSKASDATTPGAAKARSTAAASVPSGGIASPPRRPLVQVIHGGPHAMSGDQWHWRWNAHGFAAPGYMVAMVNFHGSTGWGQEFAASILARWGDQPYQDVMAATDLLIARGLVDPARMAAAGGSYGGFLAAWIASQTDRFACIVNHAGVCDFQTQFASDVTQGRRRALGGSPWESIEAMDRYNPMRHAHGFTSPMLILHGEKDYRVPYNQALELYNVYKAKKMPARLVCYPDENHWILKPRNARHWYGEVLGWLERWLKPDPNHS